MTLLHHRPPYPLPEIPDLGQRVGQFQIDSDYLREKPVEVATVLSLMLFVPTETVYHHSERLLTYTGLSPLFAPVSPGSVLPVYDIVLHNGPTPDAASAVLTSVSVQRRPNDKGRMPHVSLLTTTGEVLYTRPWLLESLYAPGDQLWVTDGAAPGVYRVVSCTMVTETNHVVVVVTPVAEASA